LEDDQTPSPKAMLNYLNLHPRISGAAEGLLEMDITRGQFSQRQRRW
jgi:hypothetical protein